MRAQLTIPEEAPMLVIDWKMKSVIGFGYFDQDVGARNPVDHKDLRQEGGEVDVIADQPTGEVG
jgi:hypothetical protein